jgi:hypothetical protein
MKDRDMMFCGYWKECKDGEGCYIALTEQVVAEAKKWMKDPPTCTFAQKPDCFKGVEE